MNIYIQAFFTIAITLLFFIQVDSQYIEHNSILFYISIVSLGALYVYMAFSILSGIRTSVFPKFRIPESYPIRISVNKWRVVFTMVTYLLFLWLLTEFFSHEGYISFNLGYVALMGVSFIIILKSIKSIFNPWHLIIDHQGVHIPYGVGLIKWEDIIEINKIEVDIYLHQFFLNYLIISVKNPEAYLNKLKSGSKIGLLERVTKAQRRADFWRDGKKYKDTINFLVDDLKYGFILEKLIRNGWSNYKSKPKT